MPSTRSLALGGGALVLVGLQGLATAQAPTGSANLGIGGGIVLQFLASLLVYLLLGGALVALGPRYADAMVSDLEEDPGVAFGWGLVAGVAVPIVLAILALTVVGLVVAIPGLIVLFVLGVVGNAVTVAWVGTVLTDSGRGVDGVAVGVGALLLAIVNAIPVLGSLVTTLVGLFGLGAVTRNAYESRGSSGGRQTRQEREAVHRRDDL